MRSLSPALIARVAAAFFGVAALGSLVPGPATTSYGANLLLFAANLFAGAVIWALPWSRWSPRATLWLAPLAFADLAAAVLSRSYNPLTFSMYYLVAFVWVGVGHRPGTALRLAPLAGLAYFVPMYVRHGLESALSAVEVVPASVAVGECLAWLSGRLHKAEARDDRRVEEMRGLVDVAEQLGRQTDPDEAPRLIARLGATVCKAQACAVFSVDVDGAWTLVADTGWDPTKLRAGVQPMKRPETAQPAPPPVSVSDFERDPVMTFAPTPALEHMLGHAIRCREVTLLALRELGRMSGVMLVARREGGIGAESFERQVLIAFARQAGGLLDRIEAVANLRSVSLSDELTGLGNRRSVDRRLEDLKVGDSLAVLDLDHFKELNDSAGHAAGDECLRRFAADVKATLRESDYAARLGGDEFLLVLPNAGANAPAVVERLRRRWSAHERLVGFSAGIAVRQADEAPSATLARADQALYLAKRGGRGITSEHGVPEELRDRASGKT